MRLTLLTIFICLSFLGLSQDLSTLMATESTDLAKEKVAYTFKGTRIVYSQSVESPHKGSLQIMFQHRFGTLDQGIYDFFGLDAAGIRFGFELGIHKNWSLGVSRNGGGLEPFGQKAYDVSSKLRLLTQETIGGFPISISWFSSLAIRSANRYDFADKAIHRLFYTNQLLFARKFSTRLSMQLMPTMIHRNLTLDSKDKNTIVSIGIGGRYKFTKRSSIVAEVYHTPRRQLASVFYPWMAAFGWEIETGGHVYHILISNASGSIEHQFIGYNQYPLYEGVHSLRLGFNLSRVFTVFQ